jgi:hypothetical protein
MELPVFTTLHSSTQPPAEWNRKFLKFLHGRKGIRNVKWTSKHHKVSNIADKQARQRYLENDGGQAGFRVGLPVGAVEPS